ncbi:hypothetical protein [Mycobacterium botniense]|uniref:Uncharacterized protein n=1 Tax=Mycobacterium botniense TaxID=84962 RepID=A0A7I9XRV8_9MYCO|nr:hypothetical protein [Mycobacterium botniense]GFG72719.1 hypothetical protein MBOT_00840 [Mycobacterium botniense]
MRRLLTDLADSWLRRLFPIDADTSSYVRRVAAPDASKVLRAAAIQLTEWAQHRDCPAPFYCRSLARRLTDIADQPESS